MALGWTRLVPAMGLGCAICLFGFRAVAAGDCLFTNEVATGDTLPLGATLTMISDCAGEIDVEATIDGEPATLVNVDGDFDGPYAVRIHPTPQLGQHVTLVGASDDPIVLEVVEPDVTPPVLPEPSVTWDLEGADTGCTLQGGARCQVVVDLPDAPASDVGTKYQVIVRNDEVLAKNVELVNWGNGNVRLGYSVDPSFRDVEEVCVTVSATDPSYNTADPVETCVDGPGLGAEDSDGPGSAGCNISGTAPASALPLLLLLLASRRRH